MKKAIFPGEPQKVKTTNNNLTNWSDEKVDKLINDLKDLN